MFRRIWGYMLALVGIKLDQMEDPEILLNQANTEMNQLHARNREQAVQALTARNNLQAEVDRTQKTVTNLQAKAEMALKNGDRDLALQILREKQTSEQSLTTLQASLQNAIQMTDQVKVAIQREEERIRTRAAEALALKTQWKQTQIENAINKTMDKWQDVGNDQAYQRAAAKISNAQSESHARAEISSGNLSNRIQNLNYSQADAAANDELAQMEINMGLRPAPAAAAAPTVTSGATGGGSDAERELAELEQRIGSNGARPAGS